MKPKFKIGDRVKWVDTPFLSNGTIKKVVDGFGSIAYIVKIDEKAPNTYAYETDELLAFPNDLEFE